MVIDCPQTSLRFGFIIQQVTGSRVWNCSDRGRSVGDSYSLHAHQSCDGSI